MTRLLHVDSSILGEKSLSRSLTAELVDKLRGDIPGLEIAYRDVAAVAPPTLSSALFFARASGAEPEDATLRADLSAARELLEEFLAADIVVIGAPMYNFSIPTQLRGWIDHLVVPGKTFAYTQSGIQGLVAGKRVIVVSTRGSLYGADSARSEQDHQEAYLRTTFGNLGVTDFAFIRAEGVALGETQKKEALAAARRDIAALAAA
ncbi:NAD(P)H-dependent oxidoreductase [Methylosinus sp. H3A]|uniref:FMN-dependent NADH-azoreductase n=1 Tax=Methylosinus sp. H3A TaxID=2785786 RepID=UPI0018C26096|nr:NAD(P)H-dependent oxidoreductase [Methylosinus sp. H3A]MBG0808908.1 NAD(P)H-dependent oxidoreductase [Methylosinus sp. H3A]